MADIIVLLVGMHGMLRRQRMRKSLGILGILENCRRKRTRRWNEKNERWGEGEYRVVREWMESGGE